jgi:ubiquinol-cytochrome c reductase cytochrome c1 subunit
MAARGTRLGVLAAALGAILLAVAIAPSPGLAAAEVKEPEGQDWTFEGIFGRFDRPQVQRGLQVYLQVCAFCHGLKYVAYRDLAGIGYDEEQIKAIAAQYEVEDGPDDEGEMYLRPGRSYDRFVSPYPNDKAAAAANNGAAPPDLSLIVEARGGGADYVYSLLVGYTEEPPEDFEVGEGLFYNPYFIGHQIAMMQPFWGDDVEYADGTEATIEQEARDVTAFLAWAAEPNLEERKRLGLSTMLFVIVMTGLFYASKRKVWKNLH